MHQSGYQCDKGLQTFTAGGQEAFRGGESDMLNAIQQPKRYDTVGNPVLAGYDVETIRRDFPILSRTVRGKPLTYLDNGAWPRSPKW